MPANPTSATRKARILFAAKLLVAAALVTWLVRGGQLDFGALAILFKQPFLLALDMGMFFLAMAVGALRYRLLLRIAQVDVRLTKLFSLQMTASFFNVVIPGNIGGDVVKALYVARDAPPEKRTTILLLTFVERLLGVSALIFVGSAVCLLRPGVWSDPLVRPLAAAVVVLGGGLVVGGAGALVLVRRLGHRLDVYTSGPSKLSKLLNQLVASMRIVSEGPRQIAAALGLSMFFHVCAIGFFTLLANRILERDVPYSAVATIFPLGLLTMMVPISPAGLGVGHVAFKRLFEAIGIEGGATVFNVFILAQNALCLLGVFPFLTLRKRGELPTADEAAPPP